MPLSLARPTPDGAQIRLAEPFEGVAQLIVEISAGELSSGVERVRALAPRGRARISMPLVIVCLAVAVALVVVTQARSCTRDRATHPSSPR